MKTTVDFGFMFNTIVKAKRWDDLHWLSMSLQAIPDNFITSELNALKERIELITDILRLEVVPDSQEDKDALIERLSK